MRGAEFEEKYGATLGGEAHPVRFNFRHSDGGETEVKFNAWDLAGMEKFGGLRDSYYIQGKCAMVMFDDSLFTLGRVVHWVSDVMRVCGEIPIVIVGNKADLPQQVTSEDLDDLLPQIREKVVEKLVELGVEGFSGENIRVISRISCKTNYNFEEPWLELAKALLEDAGLEMIDSHFPFSLFPHLRMQQR